MELSDREYRVLGVALMVYAESDAFPLFGGEDAELVWQADRAVAKELYYKFLASSAGVSTTTPRVVPLGTASGYGEQ